MFRLKSLLLILFLSLNLHSIEVVVTNKRINFNEIIESSNLKKAEVLNVKKFCIPLTLENFKTTKYIAKHYMREGFIICTKDVKKYEKNSILFNFGSIQIERDGKVVFENDDYIKIKRNDGKIEKIYKDGRVR